MSSFSSLREVNEKIFVKHGMRRLEKRRTARVLFLLTKIGMMTDSQQSKHGLNEFGAAK